MRASVMIAALVTAAPATAQFAARPIADPAASRMAGSSTTGYGPSDDVHAQIRRERRAGTLSRRDARRLERQADVNDAIAEREASGGVSPSEARSAGFRDAALSSLTKAAATQPPKR
jgi:hypothetical protein